MKSLRKIALLSSVFILSLTSCDLVKKSYCLASSNDDKFHDGMCHQVSRSEIVESFYIINPPSNPEADPEDYIYDITWVELVKNTSIKLTGGLDGKRLDRVFRISDHVIRLDVYGKTNDQDATFGYVRISNSAFTAHTNETKNATLLAYVAIGDSSQLVNKPSDAK